MPFVIIIQLLLLQAVGPGVDTSRTPSSERLLELSHPEALEITGADHFGAERVLIGLMGDRDFFEASHPTRELQTYLDWLQAKVGTGYQHRGFLQATSIVHADRESGRITLDVQEGQQWMAGDVRLEGAQLLDATWLRAVMRAGKVRGVAREEDTLPPGPEFLEPVLPLDAGRASGKEFWIPGEPAPLSQPDRVRLQTLAEAAARAAGLLSAELALRLDPTEDGVVHPTFVIREGPLHVIQSIRFEGEFQDPPAQLRQWIALPIGTPATESAMQAAVDRLQATGRFGSAGARFDAPNEDPSQVELVVNVVEAPTLPTLEDHPSADMQLMRRAMLQLLSDESESFGVDAVVTLSQEALQRFLAQLAALGLSLPVAAEGSVTLHLSLLRSSLAFEVLMEQPDADEAVLLRLFEHSGGGLLSCPPLNLQVKFPAHEASLILNIAATYAVPVAVSDKTFKVNLSGGISTSSHGSSLQFDLAVSPSALLYLYEEGIAPDSPDPRRLVRMAERSGARIRGVIDRETAKFSLDAEFESEQIAWSVRFGDLEDLGPPDWSSDSSPEPVVDTIDAAPAFLEALGESNTAADGGSRLSAQNVLALSALHAMLVEFWSPDAEGPDAGPDFVIPRVPMAESSSAEIRRMAEKGALTWMRELPPGSWGADLLRIAPFLMIPASRDELAVARDGMIALWGREDCGPFGRWLAAELCDVGGYREWASHLAPSGLKDLSSEAFVADCERLIDLESGRWSLAVAQAWRSLNDHARSDQRATLTQEQRDMLRTTFAGLESDDDEDAWLRAGLARLWVSGLRSWVEERLLHFDPSASGR